MEGTEMQQEMKWWHWVVGMALFGMVPFIEPVTELLINLTKMVLK